MSFFKKIFSSDKKDQNLSEEAKQTLDKGLKNPNRHFFQNYQKPLPENLKLMMRF